METHLSKPLPFQSSTEIVMERQYCGDRTQQMEDYMCQGYGMGLAQSLEETQDGTFSYTSEFVTTCTGPFTQDEIVKEVVTEAPEQGEIMTDEPRQEEEEEKEIENEVEEEDKSLTEKDVNTYAYSLDNAESGISSVLGSTTLLLMATTVVFL